jgi:hypothetical protein
VADGTIEEADENRYVAIGFDKSGNLLEIMYSHIDERTVKVFHAMKCRKQFRENLDKEGETMTDMTDEEYDALDELWTETTPTVNFSRPGVFARQRYLLDCLDTVTANYIQTRAEATNPGASYRHAGAP